MINQTFGLSKEISYQKSTNLQRKRTICSRPWEDQNWKSTNLLHFGAWSTKLLGSVKKNISKIYKSTEKGDHIFQTLWRQELKIYKSTAFWSMINQTFGLSKGEYLKNLQIYTEKRPYVPDPVNTRIENLQIYIFLEQDQPNFWAQQRDISPRIYKSTEKGDHMFQTLWTQELKI